jgi:type I restriction enzyme S subunit
MNAERLLAHYERIADAPDAIPRLRRFVLDLAVRGKLVPQDPSDEPAAELLKRIAAEKARLAKAGEIRKPKPLPAVDEPPFALPQNWRWTRIREVTSDRGQEVPKSRFTYIDVTAIDKEAGFVADPKVLEASEAPSRARKITRKGDVIYSCVRPYLLNVAVIETDFDPPPIASTAFAILNGHGLVMPRYIWIVLRSPFMVACVEENQRGQAYPAINDSDFAVLPFPLPPLAEQRRIVAKVDELMALCDRLEAARQTREATRDKLTAASLARLNAPDPDTFRDDARFALDALPALTARPDQIRQLRQTILNLAVRGKLVPQDPKDQPASELLKRIAKERADLIKKKEIRRENGLDPVQSAEMPFDVPVSWVWSRIGEAVLFTQYGTSQKSNPSEKGVPVLTMGNVQDGLVVWNNEKRIPETSEDLPALYLRKFDLLYNRTNSAELVGKTGIYLGEDGVRTFASYLIRLRPSLLSTNPRFLNMAMNTPEFRETQIVPLIKKQTGQANVNGTALKNMLVPLPPLAEQHRIVAKVDALMALCDRLEESLAATAVTRRRLLDALLVEALAPANAHELEAAE